METQTPKFKVRLGLFIIGGLAIFTLGIFIIGKQKNLFNPVYKLSSTFYNVSGLEVGCNVRFSGINVGTVDIIKIINDSTVLVDMLIRKEVQPFIKTDSEVSLGSSGIIGDRLIVISQGSTKAAAASDGQYLNSVEPVEIDALMTSLEVTAGNIEIISYELADIMININNSNGILGKLIQDSTFADNLDQTMVNLKNSSKGLDENMNAVKDNFLLKGYFKRKEKAAEKKRLQNERRK